MKIIKYLLLIPIFLSLMCSASIAQQFNYLTAKPKKGDGLYLFLLRYEIPFTTKMKKKFKTLNHGKFGKNGELFLYHEYKLPIEIRKFDGKTIRSSIGNNDYEYAKSIEIYNDKMFKLRVKPNDFRNDAELWIPLFETNLNDKQNTDIIPLKTSVYPLFGKQNEIVTPVDNKLDGCVYYLVSGHGGPDPGAIGTAGSYELHEDEYAYDITLRLAKNLLEHNATVYVIVQDPKDGIRSDAYLNNSFNEVYYGGDSIDRDQRTRLHKRTDIINKLNWQHRKTAKNQQVIVTHVDSRSYGKRIDIFFYYAPGSNSGKKLAETLQATVKEKYEQAQPGRGYQGSVSSRHLYVLKHTNPTCAFIELGNIRNPYDQQRLILENNRQAIANWLCDGLINASKK